MDALQALRLAIVKNEIDDNLAFAYRFSDPDGIRTGKSGYSFGRCQFDIANNPSAVTCLRECSFTDADIARLKEQTGSIDDLNAKLRANAAIVDRWDDAHIRGSLEWVRDIARRRKFSYADDEALVHVADYHNQFGMHLHGKAAAYFVSLGRPVTAEDVKTYKLGTLWGRKRPDDVRRRYNNIAKIFKNTTKGR